VGRRPFKPQTVLLSTKAARGSRKMDTAQPDTIQEGF
jgi:hypothetical protein